MPNDPRIIEIHVSLDESSRDQKTCGLAYDVDRAANPLHRARIDEELLRDLAHAVSTPPGVP
jgi:hypothetical protein